MKIVIIVVLAVIAVFYGWLFWGPVTKIYRCPDCGSDNLLPLTDMLWQCLGCQRQHMVLQLKVEKKKKTTQSHS